MKPEKRNEARRLRREFGMSIKEISKTLGVAKSSVSVWVRDIELTEEQIVVLNHRKATYAGQYWGSKGVAAKYRMLRLESQGEGRKKAREGNGLHLAGCMLYWAEGSKRKNSIEFVNSDPDLISFFVKFLRDTLSVRDENIALSVNCYLGNGLTLSEIEAFWLNLLHLPSSCLRKSAVNRQPSSSRQKGRKLSYGVCTLRIHSTHLVQHILGAIQEYAGIEKPEWLL